MKFKLQAFALFLFAQTVQATQAFDTNIEMPDAPTQTYEWTKGSESSLEVVTDDLVAEFTNLDNIMSFPSGGFEDPENFYAIYRSPEEQELLQRYMEMYPNNPPYEGGGTHAILGFEVYLGVPKYEKRQILGKGTSYEAPLSVLFRPSVSFDIAEVASEVCDGQPFHYNFHAGKNDTSISVGVDPWKYDGRLAPAPLYCPWAHILKSVRKNGKEIWTHDKGLL